MADAENTTRNLAAENARLMQENIALKSVNAKVEADRGPRAGTTIRYHRINEKVSRPGSVLSDGFIERVPKPGGFAQFAHIEYGDPETMKDRKEHTFETSAAYDALGTPGTWEFPEDEQARLEAQRAAKSAHQAP